jgi:predicted membrane channel-forming protein YqfA (hemolysin III family)
MIGILFFLFEFYDDQLLAFMVLILVWLSELFTLIRSSLSLSLFMNRFGVLSILMYVVFGCEMVHICFLLLGQGSLSDGFAGNKSPVCNCIFGFLFLKNNLLYST